MVKVVTLRTLKHIKKLDLAVISGRPILEGRHYKVTHGEDVYIVDFETNSCGYKT